MGIRANQTCFGKDVLITRSKEEGVITGFARHQRTRKPLFFVEYTSALGAATSDWFHEDELTLIA